MVPVLQSFVEGMELTVQLHRTFVDEGGQRRRGLSQREKEQVMPTLGAGRSGRGGSLPRAAAGQGCPLHQGMERQGLQQRLLRRLSSQRMDTHMHLSQLPCLQCQGLSGQH